MIHVPALPIAAETLADLLVGALDMRERETAQHSKRVACHTLVLARQFYDDAATLAQIYWGALLHDIGKIGVPDSVLLKPGPLTEAEWALMRRHPQLGYQLLAAVPGFNVAAELVLNHEERFDGSGYPAGLSGQDIPLPARLFAIIDTLDAMTFDRAYRAAQPFDAARAEISAQSGRQFDPLAVDAFMRSEAELRQMVAQHCGPQISVLAALEHVFAVDSQPSQDQT